jgi:serine/threonine-protein kinase
MGVMRAIPLLLILMLLAACGGEATPVAVLPTIAELPTQPPTPEPVGAATSSDSGLIALTEAATLTATPSATLPLTETPTLTVTPSITITDTPTRTATATPTITETPPPTSDTEGINALLQLALVATVMPTAILPAQPNAPPVAPVSSGPCPVQPPGNFGVAFLTDPALQGQIGCPVGSVLTQSSATQNYERGQMFWIAGPPGLIYSLVSGGRYGRYDDTFNPTIDPERGGETPPAGLLEPVRGFGKVWRSFPDVRGGLGWASTEETAGAATIQFFDRGQMIGLSQWGQIVILIYDPGNPAAGSWRAVAG